MVDDMTFDIGGILTDEEAEKFFEETDKEQDEVKTEPEVEKPAEEPEVEQPEEPESVGEEEIETEEDTGDNKGDGSSPTVLSSIAEALKKDGIFPDFEDSELAAVKTPEDFAELVQKALDSRLDSEVKRVRDALNNGVQPDAIRQYEQTIGYLNGISEEALNAEGDEGENLRKSLIYNDLINKGYSEDRARREIEKSFKAGDDIVDAKDALEALKDFYTKGYQKVQDDAKKAAQEAKANQQKQADSFKKMILEDEVKIGETKLDKRTCQRVFDAVSKPVYKDPDTGRLLTLVQKFQKEQPLEFLKQLGIWYVLTDGGKNMTGFTKQEIQKEKNKGIRELERKINSSSFNGGSLRYDGGGFGNGGDDLLLSDDWQVS